MPLQRLLLVSFLFFSCLALAQRTRGGNNLNQNGNKSEITFVNFSDEAVELLWYSGGVDGGFQPVFFLEPYRSVRLDSLKGHSFAYSLYNRERVVYNVPKNQDRDVHTIGLEPQADLAAVSFRVRCSTTQGDVTIRVQPSWAPLGAARFLELVSERYYDGCALNRVIPGFLTQFGICAKQKEYQSLPIPDDTIRAKKKAFKPGYLAFASYGPHARTTQVFVAMPDNSQLQQLGQNAWETPFGYVDAEDLQTVATKWYSSYGDMPPHGRGPDPDRMGQEDGYEYLKDEFPKLDYIQACRIVSRGTEAAVEEL